jgi:hypothetical protein
LASGIWLGREDVRPHGNPLFLIAHPSLAGATHRIDRFRRLVVVEMDRAVEDATGYLPVEKFERGFRGDAAVTRWLAARA